MNPPILAVSIYFALEQLDYSVKVLSALREPIVA